MRYLLDQKVTLPFQHLWLVKLIRHDFEIEYRKGKENIVTEVLSRLTSVKPCILGLSTISTSLMDEIKVSWAKDKGLQAIIHDLHQDPVSHPHYRWVNNHLNKKGRLVVGNVPTLHQKLISLYHDTSLEGYSEVNVTSKKVNNLFYWKRKQKHTRQYVRECLYARKIKVKMYSLLDSCNLFIFPKHLSRTSVMIS